MISEVLIQETCNNIQQIQPENIVHESWKLLLLTSVFHYLAPGVPQEDCTRFTNTESEAKENFVAVFFFS